MARPLHAVFTFEKGMSDVQLTASQPRFDLQVRGVREHRAVLAWRTAGAERGVRRQKALVGAGAVQLLARADGLGEGGGPQRTMYLSATQPVRKRVSERQAQTVGDAGAGAVQLPAGAEGLGDGGGP